MTLLRELIHIPERVHQGDFVLQLSRGVTDADGTLRDYVVTPQLRTAFGDALNFIQGAVQAQSSKAAYLHGSFGSGKSHFMAVLNLILSGNTHARAIPELAEVVAKHDWTHGRKFLLVPYHMIGERDMESAILGTYAEFVRRKHPEAPVPGFYLAEGLFKDAQAWRSRMGDEGFFAQLSQGAGAGGDDGWGDFAAGWDAVSFESALREPPAGEERSRLVADLIAQFFPSYQSLAGTSEAFVSLDDGLSIMSRHAQALGYDAVILFLDELVLWLASHAADASFVSREGTKLVKLVEATNADRPIPLVSFVARQRDLRDLVGDNLAGSVQLQFSDVLKHWEARFHTITLEDRNLPAIAEKRVLRPVDEAARQALQDEFDKILRVRKEVLDTLLTSTADREMFRKVYPFSPALVQTLIAVSAALQRERTALKLMMQLLVDRRDTLELGQLIPVGDLWDAIAEGDEPFSEGMRIHFDNAKRLYTQRILPLLERENGVTMEAVRLGMADPLRANKLRNEARILKTLLLAALVPEVESLKALTANRLAALNHGTFRSPIPGQEAQDLLRKCRNWAGEIGELRLTEDMSPTISIHVTGVDIEPILRAASAHDNPGNRRNALRQMLFEQLGIKNAGTIFTTYEFLWKGTTREVEVYFENARELTDDRLRGRSGSWSVFIDIPFDEPGYGPADDIAKLNAYRGGDTRTLVWMPSFLSPKALADLGRFVVLDYILQGERFDSYSTVYSHDERNLARAVARNQHAQLRVKLRSQIDVAYGVATEPRDAVSEPLSPDQQFISLDRTLAPRPPVGADLKSAFEQLLGQLFTHQYPAHPEFDTEIRAADVRKVWAEVERAIEAPEQRLLVQDQKLRRTVRSIVLPCRIAQMGEMHLLIEHNWAGHFARQLAREGGGTITVAKLREWIDTPQPMGLLRELQNLIILAYAVSTNRIFMQRGGPVEPTVDSLADDLELREQTLPDQAHWETALHRSASLFGRTLAQTRNAANVGRLVDDIQQTAAGLREPVAGLVAQLTNRLQRFGNAQTSSRLRSAQSAQSLLASLAQATPEAFVSVLAQAPLETSEAAVARTLGQAQACADTLRQGDWTVFEFLRDATDHRRTAAQVIGARLAEILDADEHVVPLKRAFEEIYRNAMQAVMAPAPAAPVPAPVPVPEPQPHPVTGTPTQPSPQPSAPPTAPPQPLPLPEPGNPSPGPGPAPAPVVVAESVAQGLSAQAAIATLQDLQSRVEQDPALRLTLSWRLERGQPSDSEDAAERNS